MNGTLDLALKGGAKFTIDGTAIHSVTPPETLFNYTYWSHAIPPFKPDTMLILGYGIGTIAELTRKIWGPAIKVTGVDTNARSVYSFNEYKMEFMDAQEYVHEASTGLFKKKFDVIIVDLYRGTKVPEFVFDIDFVVRLRSMCKDHSLVCLNVPEDDFKRLRHYYDYGFQFDRFDPVEGQRVTWWSVVPERK